MSKRILLDTNIVIHREANKISIQEIGTLFNWMDRLHYEKCVHPDSLTEIEKHHDKTVVQTMLVKLKNYNLLKTISADDILLTQLRAKYDRTTNDQIDTNLL